MEPLDKHLGHMLPKDWILQAFGNVLGAQDGQFGSNMEAQDPPKSMQEPEKVDVKKQHVFGIVFISVWASFWKEFWMNFKRKIHENYKSMLLAKTLKIVILPR